MSVENSGAPPAQQVLVRQGHQERLKLGLKRKSQGLEEPLVIEEGAQEHQVAEVVLVEEGGQELVPGGAELLCFVFIILVV